MTKRTAIFINNYSVTSTSFPLFMPVRLFRFSFCLCIVILFVQCGQHVKKEATAHENIADFPRLMPIDSVRATSFVTTRSGYAPDSCNVVYCPTFLFAWEELRRQLGSAIQIAKPNREMELVNKATAFKDALSKGEYEVTADVSDFKISIRAAFEKSLPFVHKMDTLTEPFKFNGIAAVKAFGMPYYDSKIAEEIEILYYENDDRFIIKITPQDAGQEIVLAKGMTMMTGVDDTVTGMDALFKEIVTDIKKGGEQKHQEKYIHKYTFERDDKVVIPVLRFNIEAAFKDFIQTEISNAKGNKYIIIKALQRNGFVLDENGTKVKSEAVVEAVPAAMEVPEEPIKKVIPKNFIFDKPFVVVLRKKAVAEPYFMVKVVNTSLMLRR